MSKQPNPESGLRSFAERFRRWIVHGEASMREIPAFLFAGFGAVFTLAFVILPIIISIFVLTRDVLFSGEVANREATARLYLLVLAAVFGAPFVVWRSVVLQKQADIAAGNRDLTDAT